MKALNRRQFLRDNAWLAVGASALTLAQVAVWAVGDVGTGALVSVLAVFAGILFASILTWRFVKRATVLYVRHAENIGRLARGEETRIGEKR